MEAKTAGGRFDHVSGDRGRRTFTGVLWSMTNAALTTGLTAAVFLVTSRLLSPGDFGSVAIATSLVLMAAAVVPLAFGEALTQRKTLSEAHLNAVYWLCTGSALLVYGVLLASSGAIADWFEVEVLRQILPVLGLKLVLDGMVVVPESLVIRRMAFRVIALRTALASTIAGAVCIAMALAGFALWALVASQILVSAINLAVTARAAGWRPGLRTAGGGAALRELRSFGLYSMGSRLIDGARFDQFLIGALLGPIALGFYFFAMRINDLLSKFTTQSLSSVFAVALAGAQDDRAESRRIYLHGTFASAALGFPVFGGLILVAPLAVPLVFGPQWQDAVRVVQFTAGISLVASVGIMQAALIRASGDAGWWFRYRALSQAAGFALIVVLAPLGLTVMAAGLLCRTLLLWPVSVAKTLRLLDFSAAAYARVFAAPLTALGLMAVVVLGLPLVGPAWSGSALLAAQIVLGGVTYAVSLVLLARATFRDALALIRRNRGGKPT